MTDILFIPDEGNPDIQYKEKGIIHYAEVKSLRDIDPEYPIIDNKLEAISLIEPDFIKDYYVQLNDASENFNSLEDYEKGLEVAVNKLIELLRNFVNKKTIDNLKFPIDNFEFIVSFKTKNPGYHLMYSGEIMKYGSSKDIFLKMSSVYSRFINSAAKGIKQLVKKRNKNFTAIKNDRLYVFLNTGRHHNFIPDELGQIIDNLSKLLGIKDLVTLKVEL